MTTNNERVADTSKTIDHIADVNKKVSLTEQWKKGELPFGEYWCKVVGSPYIEQVMSDCMTDEDIVEIFDKVPNYTEWREMKEQRDACAWALDRIGDVLVKHKLVKKTDKELEKK